MSKVETDAQNLRTGVPAAPADRSAGSMNAIETEALMAGRREVTIVHAGERYRLRITANNKLILTK